MKLYYTSVMIQDNENSKPWSCSMQDSCTTIEDAKEIILKARKKFRVLSAWIDTYDGANNKITVFHECYVNFIGYVERPGKVGDCMKYYGKITYEIDENHPDVNNVAGGWHKGKVFEYEDTYEFDGRLYSPEDHDIFVNFIKRDLKLVASGGYSSGHIHNVKFEIRRIA